MNRATKTTKTATALLGLLGLLVLAGAGAPGCGNYSDEDLEFINALPEREEMTVELPPRAGALIIGAAEGWRTAWKVSRIFNATAEGLLALVDSIRSSYPTSRNGQTRVWGPFPAEEHPGWQIEFSMVKNVALDRFEYRLEMLPPPGVTLVLGGTRTVILAGQFTAGAAARNGVGHLDLSPGEARQAGVVFKDLDRLQTLALDYDYRGGPRNVNMDLGYDPPLDPATDVSHAAYHYRQDDNQRSVMQFDLDQNLVDGPAIETFHILSQWLPDGRGREDREITAGDGAGLMAVECWNTSFRSTYQSVSWVSPPTGAPTGDPATCLPVGP